MNSRISIGSSQKTRKTGSTDDKLFPSQTEHVEDVEGVTEETAVVSKAGRVEEWYRTREFVRQVE